jgi:hypothetical protein
MPFEDRQLVPICHPHLGSAPFASEGFDALDPGALPDDRPGAALTLEHQVLVMQVI